MTGLSLFGTIWVLSIHHTPPSRPVPRWLRRLILYYLPRCLGMNIPPYHDGDKPGRLTVAWTDVSLCSADGGSGGYMLAKLRKMDEDSRKDQLREEWHTCSRVIDRCHLILFSIVIIAGTVAMLVLLLWVAPIKHTR